MAEEAQEEPASPKEVAGAKSPGLAVQSHRRRPISGRPPDLHGEL